MDYRCPFCGKEVRNRKLAQSIVARMEIDCPHCRSRIRLNVHRAEEALVFLVFAALALLAALTVWSRSQSLALVVLAVAALAAAALPVLERTYLRDWLRYAPPPNAENRKP